MRDRIIEARRNGLRRKGIARRPHRLHRVPGYGRQGRHRHPGHRRLAGRRRRDCRRARRTSAIPASSASPPTSLTPTIRRCGRSGFTAPPIPGGRPTFTSGSTVGPTSSSRLLFRDWLKANPAVREEYLAVKRRALTARDYADAKEPWFADAYRARGSGRSPPAGEPSRRRRAGERRRAAAAGVEPGWCLAGDAGVSSGAPHCSTPYSGSSLGRSKPRRDELIGLGDDLVVDQDLAMQVGPVRPLDGQLHAGQLRVGQHRVDLERAAGQQGRLVAVDVLVVDLVRDDCSAGRAVCACPVDDVVQYLFARRGLSTSVCGSGSGSASAVAGNNCAPAATTATAAIAEPSALGGAHSCRHYNPALELEPFGNPACANPRFWPSQDHRLTRSTRYRGDALARLARAPQRSPAADAAARQQGAAARAGRVRVVPDTGQPPRQRRHTTVGYRTAAAPGFIEAVQPHADFVLIKAGSRGRDWMSRACQQISSMRRLPSPAMTD